MFGVVKLLCAANLTGGGFNASIYNIGLTRIFLSPLVLYQLSHTIFIILRTPYLVKTVHHLLASSTTVELSQISVGVKISIWKVDLRRSGAYPVDSE